ncbi:bifunctional 3-(3-hydroxy-phenyl)propionate/3-hydroxycinnamic acid hydroxylase [Actinomadura nitritigenes]|uniref:Bifunctional 3-(3-hydroxy-phenyl)propionate/3-hydroxycinnamic acid hydroxylase n=1 Tax=Actinomadura nitritigenes TaxID=134602 RepID=A0ABS3RFH7_9ACTN|nr:bifunctional 3-(3-hydroxy-phenyl)propionate/3-hydroxycinnamic acid hydroxylase [Actinomadura nitritigenes]MBO2444993.1 bifunctional 3-(3-hydroxy-phenyl)propionate/3-hydroxycinnamic acid hydroxylase [Actinomadura nitritigenes]
MSAVAPRAVAGTAPVMIIGAGPTGSCAAILLARYGVSCVVLDRWETVYPQPRAVHLDDEVHRILGRLGVAEEFAAISRPALGLRLLDGDLRVLAEFERSAATGRHGCPEANMFDQPELERILRARMAEQPEITFLGGVEVTGVHQDDVGVHVEYTEPGSGSTVTRRARYVLGCDGANSLVRRSIGAVMRDLNFDQRWLVVDVATDADLGQWEGVHQVCDPERAATYMRIGRSRYRWEFRLLPGETAADFQAQARLRPLLSPWTAGVPDDALELVRVAEYTFRAQIADRWRDRRVLLLGDAAHLTPPFIGQGMGAGLRDAANLAWKLAAVWHGTLPEAVLDTYETEREPHARTMIRRAKLIGVAMTQGGRTGSLLRRLIAPRLHRIPGTTHRILDSRSPALRRSRLVLRSWQDRRLPGTLCPNAALPDGSRFDQAAGDRFTIVSGIAPSPVQRAEIERRRGVVVIAEPGGDLDRWLRDGRAAAAVVRPDGTVLRTGRDLERLCSALPGHGRAASSTPAP